MNFISPTKGPMSFEAMFDDIVEYVGQEPQAPHRLIVGTDSQTRDDLLFVTAVVVHRLGKGARYYYSRRRHKRMASLRQKIYYETSLSLGLGSRITERLARNGYSKLDVEIHLDVGQGGETRDLIREVVGMVTGSGFDAKIKPNAYGASKVADKHTK
ncbi:MAG: ribonuclease H-like YkuK family protein [Bacillota bacterium]